MREGVLIDITAVVAAAILLAPSAHTSRRRSVGCGAAFGLFAVELHSVTAGVGIGLLPAAAAPTL